MDVRGDVALAHERRVGTCMDGNVGAVMLTKRAQQRLHRIDRVRSSLCVHNFNWGARVAGDYCSARGVRASREGRR